MINNRLIAKKGGKLVLVELKKEVLEEGLNALKSECTRKGFEFVEVFNSKTHHLCKYCGEVTYGDYEDLLCNDCREVFGHSLYSEL